MKETFRCLLLGIITKPGGCHLVPWHIYPMRYQHD